MFMAVINEFDSKFHKSYVGGEGEVVDKSWIRLEGIRMEAMSFEEIREEYRRYVNDPSAELPEPLLEELRVQGKVVSQ